MNKQVYLAMLFFSICQSLIAQYDGDQLFDDSYLHEIQITSLLSIDDLDDLFEYNAVDHIYSLAQVTIDGTSIDSIGVRVKGGISSFDSKKPLKLDFNEFVLGKKYDGLKKLNLHQGNMDPTFMRESLAYSLFRNAGVKTVRTSFAKVYYNGTYEGIYTIVEQIDDNMINQLFASSDGALYKTEGSGLSLKYEIDNSFTYGQFESVINQIPINILHEQLPNYLDVESFLRFIAIEVQLMAVDGPITSNYNYYIYFEPKSGTYVYIPWDYNLSLYGGADHDILQNTANFFFEKIKQNTTLRDRYLDIFCDLLQYNFEEGRLLDQIAAYRTLLENEVPLDPYIDEIVPFDGIGDFEPSVTFLENLISTRTQELNTEMATDFGACSSLVNPIQNLDVSINEVVASNDLTSGIVDPAGGAADWIELYNNTSNSISLSGFYLSNDIDFLKHWKFPEDAVIPANDYLIVWADRDVAEQGLHTDFKLKKSQGALYLSFENGDIIDAVTFTNQSTNIGLARVPNGTGSFVTQATTFNGSNDSGSSAGDCDDSIAGFQFLGSFENHHYFQSNDAAAWADAKDIALQYNANLVAINSAAENDFIQSQINQICLIGLSDQASEGTYLWSNSDPFTFSNFESEGATVADDFGSMNFWNGQWTMVNQSTAKPYIMEQACNVASSQIVHSCAPDQSYQSFTGSSQALNWQAPTASTNCPNGIVDIVQISGPSPNSIFQIGQSELLTYELSDQCGSTVICTFSVALVEECPQQLFVSVASQPVHKAINELSSNATLANGSQINFEAGQCIELQSGFSVPLGATFSANIKACTTGQ